MRRCRIMGVGAVMVMAGAAMGEMEAGVSVFVAGTGAADTAPAATENGAAAEMVDNPSYTSWAKHAVGTQVTIKTHAKTEIQGAMAMSQTMDIQMTTRLVEVTAKEAVVEMTLNAPGMGLVMKPQRQSIPAKVAKPAGAGLVGAIAGKKVREGKERVEVLGEVVEAKWEETTDQAEGTAMRSKVWTSEAVPGLMVKGESEVHSESMSQSSTMKVVGIVEGAAPATQPGK